MYGTQSVLVLVFMQNIVCLPQIEALDVITVQGAPAQMDCRDPAVIIGSVVIYALICITAATITCDFWFAIDQNTTPGHCDSGK